MTLTGLEVVLVGLFVGLVASVSTWIFTTAKYQCRANCDERHKAIAIELVAIKARQASDIEQIMRMLRAIVMHLPIGESEKITIINDRRDRVHEEL